jgi:hypothetical protein
MALFGVIVSARIPYALSRSLSYYSASLFLAILAACCVAFRVRSPWTPFAALSLTLLLFGLTLSFAWTSGYTDTGMIGGLLPYKDAKNYYFGALQILNGLPIEAGIQAVRRPLFPGMLASVLWLTGSNLKLTLAILTLLGGLSLYFSARVVRDSLGPWAAGLFAALMYFYIQPRMGYSVSEVGGFILGCWGFSILWMSAARRSWPGLLLGLATLMSAISARAGAFFIFPALVLWAGWIFRGSRRFSLGAAGLGLVGVLAFYILDNQVFSTLLDMDLARQWGSFAYAMYGQVHGGTGWHSAIDALHTTQTSVVMAATLRFFAAHPLSFAIAVIKSYGDFFLPGPFMIFAYGAAGEASWLTYALWITTAALLVAGLIRSISAYRSALPSLLVACFVGTLLSIPFLPPIDSGARFHAGSIGFFFVLPAAALVSALRWQALDDPSSAPGPQSLTFAAVWAGALLALTLIAPVAIYRLTPSPSPSAPACPSSEHAFVLRAAPQAYIDLVPPSTRGCPAPFGPGGGGLVPDVCLADMQANATDKQNDDFVQALLFAAQDSPDGLRVVPTINLLDGSFHYFASPPGRPLPLPANQLVEGCALEVATLNGSLYRVTGSPVP